MIDPTRVVPRKTSGRSTARQAPQANWPAGKVTSAPLRTAASSEEPHSGQPSGARLPCQPHAVQNSSFAALDIVDLIGVAAAELE
jgi:hypothetical protein